MRLILIDLCMYMLYITLHYPVAPMSLGTNKAIVLDINICPGQVNSVFGQVACLMQLSHPFSTRKNSHHHTSSPACPWCGQIRGCVQLVRELSTNQCFCCKKKNINKSSPKGLIHILHPPLDSHEITLLTLEKLWDPTCLQDWRLETGLMTAQSPDRTAKVP